MNIIVNQVQARVPVAVVSLKGDLDGSNYMALIDQARQVYGNGTRHMLLDLTQVPYMSSAGVVALHTIALLLGGEQPPDPQHGWASLRSLGSENRGTQHQLKLLGLQAHPERTLMLAGMKEFFEVYPDLESALASF